MKNEALKAEVNTKMAAELEREEAEAKKRGISKWKWRGPTVEEKPELPGLLTVKPSHRTTRDRPKALGISYVDACETYRIGQEVEIECFRHLPQGCQVLINGIHRGIVHNKDYTARMRGGEFRKAFVQEIREDGVKGRIDLSFEKINYEDRMEECMERIMRVLRHCEGTLKVGDRTEPAVIRELFQMSKENFKKACARLWVCGLVGRLKQPEPQLFIKSRKYDMKEKLEWFRQRKKSGDAWAMVAQEFQPPEAERMKPKEPPRVFKWTMLPGAKFPRWLSINDHPMAKPRAKPTQAELETMEALKIPEDESVSDSVRTSNPHRAL